MLEEAIQATKSKHSKTPISEEAYKRWRASKVTLRLFDDLELAVVDSYRDYLTETSADNALIGAMIRQGAMKMIELVLDWSPAGVEGPNDED